MPHHSENSSCEDIDEEISNEVNMILTNLGLSVSGLYDKEATDIGLNGLALRMHQTDFLKNYHQVGKEYVEAGRPPYSDSTTRRRNRSGLSDTPSDATSGHFSCDDLLDEDDCLLNGHNVSNGQPDNECVSQLDFIDDVHCEREDVTNKASGLCHNKDVPSTGEHSDAKIPCQHERQRPFLGFIPCPRWKWLTEPEYIVGHKKHVPNRY